MQLTPHWVAFLGVIVAVFIVLEGVFFLWGDTIAKWFPGLKTKGLSWGLRILGVIAAMDPQIFAPLFHGSPYAGILLFLIGQLIQGVRTVTGSPGSNISAPLKSAIALHTLVRLPASDVAEGTKYLTTRERSPLEKKLTTQVGSMAARKIEVASGSTRKRGRR